MNAASLPALDLLREMFPNKMRISTSDLASTLGLNPQSIRNAVGKKTFPIRTYIDGHLMYADLRDVAAHLDSMREVKRIGRPTKASKLSAAQ